MNRDDNRTLLSKCRAEDAQRHGDKNRKLFSKCMEMTTENCFQNAELGHRPKKSSALPRGPCSWWGVSKNTGYQHSKVVGRVVGCIDLEMKTENCFQFANATTHPPMPTQSENKTSTANQKFHRGAG